MKTLVCFNFTGTRKTRSLYFHADEKLAMVHYDNNCFFVMECLKAFLVAHTMVIARFGWTTKLVIAAPFRVPGTNTIPTCHIFSFSQNEGYLATTYQVIWVKLKIYQKKKHNLTHFNPLWTICTAFLYPLKTSEKRKGTLGTNGLSKRVFSTHTFSLARRLIVVHILFSVSLSAKSYAAFLLAASTTPSSVWTKENAKKFVKLNYNINADSHRGSFYGGNSWTQCPITYFHQYMIWIPPTVIYGIINLLGIIMLKKWQVYHNSYWKES